jgi:NADH-quinone oxidoreductase subunit A
VSYVLGPKKPTPEKLVPLMWHAAGWRCPRAHAREVLPRGDDFPGLFDIEVAFLPWAMALRELGWAVQVVLFMTLLLAGYVYVWRKGALDWGAEKQA